MSSPQTKTGQLITGDAAHVLARRAASFVLAAHVCRIIAACRANLSVADRERLHRGALVARHRGLALASRYEVRTHFQIDEESLRRRSVGVARFLMQKAHCDARNLKSEIVDAAISSTRGETKLSESAALCRASVSSVALAA